MKSYALRVGTTRSPPRPGPIPPVFERFTVPALSAIAAGERTAAELEHEYVEPFHLLLGLLRTEGSLGAEVLRRHQIQLEDAVHRAQLRGPRRAHQATGIFSDAARQIVAQDALRHAYQHGEARIGTGHVLLAVVDTNGLVTEILGAGPVSEEIAAEVMRELSGDEDPDGSVRRE